MRLDDLFFDKFFCWRRLNYGFCWLYWDVRFSFRGSGSFVRYSFVGTVSVVRVRVKVFCYSLRVVVGRVEFLRFTGVSLCEREGVRWERFLF